MRQQFNVCRVHSLVEIFPNSWVEGKEGVYLSSYPRRKKHAQFVRRPSESHLMPCGKSGIRPGLLLRESWELQSSFHFSLSQYRTELRQKGDG